MANDAKLGLVLGVAVVLVIGLVFFRSDPTSAKQSPTTASQQTSHLRKSGSQQPIVPSAQIETK